MSIDTLFGEISFIDDRIRFGVYYINEDVLEIKKVISENIRFMGYK